VPEVKLKAAEARHLVQIQRRRLNTTTYGEQVEIWDTVAEAYAAIRSLTTREYFAAMQVQSSATHEIRMRWPCDMTVRDRIKFGARAFDIVNISDRDERHIELTLTCAEHGLTPPP
jgi:SPP1 family predicted phage head-tail adaptor